MSNKYRANNDNWSLVVSLFAEVKNLRTSQLQFIYFGRISSDGCFCYCSPALKYKSCCRLLRIYAYVKATRIAAEEHSLRNGHRIEMKFSLFSKANTFGLQHNISGICVKEGK